MPSSVKEVCVYSMLSDSRRASSRASAIMRREVHAGHSGAAAREEARVVAFAAPGVEHTPPAQIADEREERRVVEPFAGDVGTAARPTPRRSRPSSERPPRRRTRRSSRDVVLDHEVFGHEHRAGGRAHPRVVADEHVLYAGGEDVVLADAAYSGRHAVAVVTVEARLGPERVVVDLDPFRRRRGQPELARLTLRTPARACRTSAIDARRPSETKTAPVWPSRTFTRVHVTLISAGCSERI